MKVKLNKSFITNFSRPYIIAELSGNHGGSLNRALLLVKKAKEAGADAIKLQTFKPDSITLNSKKKDFKINDSKSLWRNSYLYQLYTKAQTPWAWHEKIFKYAKKINIDFFSSAFDEEAVDFLESLNVRFYKISSFENNHYPLIEKVISTNKPLIISTGASSLGEIDKLISFFKKKKYNKFILLKCVSSYPAKFKSMNLNAISFLQKRYNCPIGLSDHSIGHLAPIISVNLGACVIEKHIKLDSDKTSVDSKFAMSASDFKKMCLEIRGVKSVLGDGIFRIDRSEINNRRFKRSIYISKNVKKGELVNKDNIKIIRPSFGLEPNQYEKVIGKKFKNKYQLGTALKFKMIS